MNNLTILIPTRNRPHYLRVALASVKATFGAGIKVTIGDNGDHEVTRAMIKANDAFGLSVHHVINPPGSTYPFNLKTLIGLAETEWISILHDDDFFIGHPLTKLIPLLKDVDVDFIFSDHWLASEGGEILTEQTNSNSKLYGRSTLREGPVADLADCAAGQAICLDGFFIRRKVAQSRPFDSRLKLFSDIKWLIEVTDSVRHRGWYLSDRFFAYRVHQMSNTGLHFDHIDNYEAHKTVKIGSTSARKRIERKLLRMWWTGFKYGLKRRQFTAFILRNPFPVLNLKT